MEVHQVALILAAGVAMGFINNLAGAAGALGLMAFEYSLGMTPMEANASIRLSALAIGGFGLVGFLSKGQRLPPRVWSYALLTIPGAVAGSLLVRPRFELLFQLTLAALMVLALLQTLGNRSGADAPGAARKDTPLWLLFLLFSWLGAHMGFIQVGTGIVSIFILSMVHSRDLVQVNVAKMVFVLVAAITSNATLAVANQIHWGPALTLALGAGTGSFLASRWSVRKGHRAVRIVVVLICIAVLLHVGIQLLRHA